MGDLGQRLQLALREWRVPLALWAGLSALLAVAGPFDTYRLLAPLPRFGYWAVVVGVSIGLDHLFRRMMAGQTLPQRLIERVGFALGLAALVHGINLLIFGGWAGWADFAYLAGVVWLVAAVVELGHRLVFAPNQGPSPEAPQDDSPAGPGPAPVPPPQSPGFLRHVPAAMRGTLIRIEAQDHYLNVVTDAGSALVLMRFGDAVAELSEVAGARVHRSHWVARAGVARILRKEGRQFLLMRDGAEVPVSRANRAALRELGLD
jgi:hypothetical protein